MFNHDVYIPCGPDFFANYTGKFDLNYYLEEIAFVLKKDDKGNSLVIDDEACLARTRNYVLREANKFISGFEEIESEENMPSRISKTQFRLLNRTLKNKKGRITCYTMIILHIIYCLLKQENINIDTNIADAIKEVVNEYYRYYPTDELARFLIDCHEVTVSNPGESKTNGDFPPVLKKHPQNIENESENKSE